MKRMTDLMQNLKLKPLEENILDQANISQQDTSYKTNNTEDLTKTENFCSSKDI